MDPSDQLPHGPVLPLPSPGWLRAHPCQTVSSTHTMNALLNQPAVQNPPQANGCDTTYQAIAAVARRSERLEGDLLSAPTVALFSDMPDAVPWVPDHYLLHYGFLAKKMQEFRGGLHRHYADESPIPIDRIKVLPERRDACFIEIDPCLFLLFFCPTASSQVYKWRDKDGNLIISALHHLPESEEARNIWIREITKQASL